MASNEYSRTAPFGAIAIYRVISAIQNELQVVSAWNKSRRTRKALHALSDATLEDIGLSRGDIARF